MPLEFLTLDVFTDRAFEGNPLAVFPDADGLSGALMQRIANEFNLSETVFVLPPEKGGDARLRIFSPKRELPFAGHPTIGTAIALSMLGRAEDRLILEEEAGPVPVTVEGGAAWLTSPRTPRCSEAEAGPADLAAVLGLKEHQVKGAAICDAGQPFTFIELADAQAVDLAALDLGVWRRALAGSSAPDLYIFCRPPQQKGDHGEIYSRMFAPSMGIPEDPATGAAAVALAGWLEPGRYHITQGVKMGRPSLLMLEAGPEVRLGGRAIQISGGALLVQDR